MSGTYIPFDIATKKKMTPMDEEETVFWILLIYYHHHVGCFHCDDDPMMIAIVGSDDGQVSMDVSLLYYYFGAGESHAILSSLFSLIRSWSSVVYIVVVDENII